MRAFYEEAFSSEHYETMVILVKVYEVVGNQIREWGTYKVGDSPGGCYVILRHKDDGWRIYREWLVEPCGE